MTRVLRRNDAAACSDIWLVLLPATSLFVSHSLDLDESATGELVETGAADALWVSRPDASIVSRISVRFLRNRDPRAVSYIADLGLSTDFTVVGSHRLVVGFRVRTD